MHIGFAQIDITPETGAALCGQPFPVVSTGVESPLLARAMCLDDGLAPVLLASADVLLLTNDLAASVRTQAARRTGVPDDRIILCATHTHSGPSTAPVLGSTHDAASVERVESGLAAALEEAWKQRRPGVLRIASGRLPGYAFNRRFVMSDGAVQTHPLKDDPHIVCPEGPDSEALVVLQAVGADGVPMGGVINFGCHGTVLGRRETMISSDFPGKACAQAASRWGAGTTVLFLQGACGNICQVNPLDVSRHEVGPDWAKTMGSAVGDGAVDLASSGAVATCGPLRVVTETIRLPRRVIDARLVEWALRHRPTGAALPVLSDYGVERFGTTEVPLVSLEVMFHTPYWADFYANEIIRLEEMRRDGPELPLTIKVVAQDNWAMVTLPCELFVEWGQAICEASPFEVTAVVELANGWNGYIPTRKAFARPGGYETKEVTSTMLAPEAGEVVFDTVRGMLARARGE